MTVTDFDGVLTEPKVPLRQLSPSAVKAFATCPEKFRRTYLKKEWEPSSGAAVLGTAFHDARQANYEQKVWSGEDLPVKEVMRAYHLAFSRGMGGDVKLRKSEDPAKLRDLGARMTYAYHLNVSPTVHPVAVEERFETWLPGVEVPYVCRLDVRTKERRIIDTKTDTKGQTEPKPEWRIQALAYMAALPDYDFAWHVIAKTARFPVNTPETHPKLLLTNTVTRRNASLLLVQTVWTQLVALYGQHGDDEPWSGAGLAGFSCRFCHLWRNCVYWA